jgi:predicted  nucleic acid-binding Zn-ribbon protein
MARETKKDPQELTVEEKLKTLYQLQSTLSKIDEIKTLRGELPLEVEDLEDEVVGLNTRIDNIKANINELRRELVTRKADIEKANSSIAKYKEQLDNVSNNRQYDLLSKEIEYQQLEVELAEKKTREANEALEARQIDLAQTIKDLDERNNDLIDKKAELEEIVAETKQEEERLREKSKDLETRIEPRLLQSFKRIRKNTRNGLGIVYVQRDACGGCFNHIPPQRQLDIKSHKKIIVCEYCGRIMIDPELAGVVLTPKDAPKERSSRRRRAVVKNDEEA